MQHPRNSCLPTGSHVDDGAHGGARPRDRAEQTRDSVTNALTYKFPVRVVARAGHVYLDIPFQHGSARILKDMQRPAAAKNTLQRIQTWRSICPDITLHSTFIVGFPGETDADFDILLDFLTEAQLDRVGCFQYSPVDGARANELPDHVPAAVMQERWDRFMAVGLSQRRHEPDFVQCR